jgi:TatA/E family protein of Tat protein translocase
MLSIPHMLVVFVIVLVVFGPQKLPELARTLGKLMAEFRKASTDFRGAFEEEMRDLERQAREVERKKTADAAAKAAEAAPVQAATFATPAGTETPEAAAAADGQMAGAATGFARDGDVRFTGNTVTGNTVSGNTASELFKDVDADAFGEAIDARVTEGSKELVVTPVAEAVARGKGEQEVAVTTTGLTTAENREMENAVSEESARVAPAATTATSPAAKETEDGAGTGNVTADGNGDGSGVAGAAVRVDVPHDQQPA